MKVLFATTNPAKVKKYKEPLKECGIDLITINDLDFELDVEETGKDAIENSYIKAKAYYDKLNIPCIGMDNSLFIKELPEEKQPGTHVRRVNGKRLSDEEMIEYYTDLATKYGGDNERLTAMWIFGMTVIDSKGIRKDFSWKKDHFYLVNKASEKRNPGYPLDSISMFAEDNEYFIDRKFKNSSNDKSLEKNENAIKSKAIDDEVIMFLIKSIK